MSIPMATGRYMLAVVRGERPEPPRPYAYDLNRWIFVEDERGALIARLELTNDEEREVSDWIVSTLARRSRA